MAGSQDEAKGGSVPVVKQTLVAKTDPKPYSLEIIRMECFNPNNKTIIPFIPLRKDINNKVNSVWTKANPDSVIWGFVGSGVYSKFEIYAQFEFKDSNGNNVEVAVEALSGSPPSTGSPPYSGPLTSGVDSFGTSKATVTRVDASRSDRSPKKTNTARFVYDKFSINGFSKRDIIFIWKYKDVNGKMVLMKTIIATVYFIPFKPNLPWMITENESNYNENQNPWTDALDMLLNWGVKGYTNATEIATQITKHVNSNIYLSYDTARGSSSLTSGDQQQFFYSSDFIAEVKAGRTQKVNCTDCATIVSTFSNLLGADLYQTRFGKLNKCFDRWIGTYYEFLSGFYCNKVKGIGNDDWRYPLGGDANATSGGFSYHEIAFSSAQLYTSKIYDACLKVNSNVIKANKKSSIVESELLPKNIQFAAMDTYTNADIVILQSGDQLLKDVQTYLELLVLNTFNNLNNAKITEFNIVGVGGWKSNRKERRSLI